MGHIRMPAPLVSKHRPGNPLDHRLRGDAASSTSLGTSTPISFDGGERGVDRQPCLR
jgi:hypothetical protein